jgi:hypothetical protein
MRHPTGRPLACALDGVVYAVAWADLAPSFRRAAGDMAVLRQMTQDFREPVICVLFDIVAAASPRSSRSCYSTRTSSSTIRPKPAPGTSCR